MIISFPSTSSIKDSIRNAIGREVDFVITTSGTPCPLCVASGWYDPINELSLNYQCPSCSGLYWLNTEKTITVNKCHVRWKTSDTPSFEPAGLTFEGDVNITISVNDLTSEQISNIKHIIVDNKKVQPYSIVYRGVPTVDRVRFTCRQSEKV